MVTVDLWQSIHATNLPFVCIAFPCILFIAAAVLRRRHGRLPLPPGPKTSWVGSVQLPKTYQWKTYAQWRKTYGDLIYVYIFGNPIIVLNSARAVNDLLDKRGGIYSSRPCRTMVSELMGWKWLFSSMPYGPQWRKHRALFHQYFNAGNTSDYHPLQLKETHVMLRNLAESPDVIYHHVRRSAAAVVMKASYGHQIAPEGDIYVTLADEALTGLAQSGIFGTFLVDYIPLLKYIPAWMPGAGFQRKARAWRKANQSMLNMPFEMVKQRMASNTAVPCFVTAELERGFQSSSQEYDEQLIKDVAAIAYAAGADTTVSAILSFFLAMTAYPEVLKKLQGEIDRVVGNERLPDFSDRNSIPYVDWVVWECLRWNPVTPFGLAHQVIEDDVYDGYWIPKGTTIIPNVWGILHDETTYPDPLRFDPDRYADSNRDAELGINELPYPAFGFGRRMCPGRWLAIDSVWIAVATVAATFDVLKALDEKGVPQEPDIEYTSTLLSRPKSLRCRIVPRSDATAALISQTAEYV